MTRIDINSFGSIGEDNVRAELDDHEPDGKFLDSHTARKKIGKSSEDIINTYLEETINQHEEGAVILLELPTETYFEANIASVKFLTSNGFDGVYISFQRPFKNIYSLFKQQGIDVNKLLIIDGATAFCEEEHEKNSRCIHISPDMDVTELAKVINESLQKLESKKRFVFIDSLTTMTLYKSLSDAMKFSEMLVDTVRRHDIENITLLLNVAEDLSKKRFIKDIALHVDEVINVVHYVEQYVDEVISPDVLT